RGAGGGLRPGAADGILQCRHCTFCPAAGPRAPGAAGRGSAAQGTLTERSRSMIRIAIVEDDAQVREQLMDDVHRYERQFGRMFEFTTFSDGDEIVSDYRPVYDIILLDVQMQRMDGMAAAEAIRQMDSDVILIFITNMAQFAIRGYAVDALDYVLKPVPYFAFSQQLQKAVARLQARQKTFLTVPVEGGLRRVDVATLYYLEIDGHKVRLYAEDGELT